MLEKIYGAGDGLAGNPVELVIKTRNKRDAPVVILLRRVG